MSIYAFLFQPKNHLTWIVNLCIIFFLIMKKDHKSSFLMNISVWKISNLLSYLIKECHSFSSIVHACKKLIIVCPSPSIFTDEIRWNYNLICKSLSYRGFIEKKIILAPIYLLLCLKRSRPNSPSPLQDLNGTLPWQTTSTSLNRLLINHFYFSSYFDETWLKL